MQTRDGISCQLRLMVLSVELSHIFLIAVRWQVTCVYKWPKVYMWFPQTWTRRQPVEKRRTVKQSDSFKVKQHSSLVVENSANAWFLITATWCKPDLTISAWLFQPVTQRNSREGAVGYGFTFSKYVFKNADEHLSIKLMIQMKYLEPLHQRFFTFL